MNQEIIGKFISKERKNKNLTQKELADKLNISEKTISKWECGKGLPEVSLMQPLCKELNITVNELLNGAKDQKEDTAIIDYVKYERKQSNKKIIILTIVSILLITFILSTVIYFFNSYNKIAVYSLTGTGENFAIEESILTKSNMYNILTPGKIISTNESLSTENIIAFSLRCDETTIVGGKGTYKDVLFLPIIEKTGYNEILSPYKLENLDKWNILIKYRYKGQDYEEIIPLKNKIIMKNNEFVSIKVASITEGTTNYEKEKNEVKKIKEEKAEKYKKYSKLLKEEGFQNIEDNNNQLKKILSNNEYLIFNTEYEILEYHNQVKQDHTTIKGNLVSKESSDYKMKMFGINIYVYKNEKEYNYRYYINLKAYGTEPDDDPNNILVEDKELNTFLDNYEQLQKVIYEK